ncbi:MAG: bacillithiol system redox-active protein YtxJ [Desulfitobacteriaceae bacterium]
MADFKEIKNSQEFAELLDESFRRKIILFKHSTTCPISACAWREVQDFILGSQDEVLVVMIKVIESRAVSNQVAEELGVMHQSPQALLLSNGKVLWQVSHQAVIRENIAKALDL